MALTPRLIFAVREFPGTGTSSLRSPRASTRTTIVGTTVGTGTVGTAPIAREHTSPAELRVSFSRSRRTQ